MNLNLPPTSPCQKRSFSKTNFPIKRPFRQDSIEKIKNLFYQATNGSEKFHLMIKVAEEAFKHKNIKELNNSLSILSKIIMNTSNPSTKFYYQRFLLNFHIKIYGINAKIYLQQLTNPLLKIELLTKLATFTLLNICHKSYKNLIEYFKNPIMLNTIKTSQNYNTAMKFFKEAETIAKSTKNTENKNFAYQLIATAYFGINENQILLNATRISDIDTRTITLINIGRNYLNHNLNNTARKFFRQARENIPFIKHPKIRSLRLNELRNLSTNHLLLLD